MTPITMQTPEAVWLFLSTLAVCLMWLPHIVQLIIQEGPVAAVWDPTRETPHKAAWAERARRAHGNAVENIAVFAPLMLLVLVTGATSQATATAAVVFFFARLTHYLSYSLAIPAVRVIAFLVGWAATITVACALV